MNMNRRSISLRLTMKEYSFTLLRSHRNNIFNIHKSSKKVKILFATVVIITFAMLTYSSSWLSNSNFFKGSRKHSFIVETQGCKIRRFDPLDPVIMATTKIEPYRPCSNTEELTYIHFDPSADDYIIKIKEDILKYNLSLICSYQAIFRITEQEIFYGTTVIFASETTIPKLIEHVFVICEIGSKQVYKNAYALIRNKRTTNDTKKDAISVIILGIDSISSNSLIRNMPKTWAYLQSKEYWFNIPGYNRIGENTYPNVMALMTGLSIYDDIHPCHEDNLDQCPIIWKHFRDNGYVTAYAEDVTWMSTFNNMKPGFKKQPTDHYFRPYIQSIMKMLEVQSISYSPFCIGYKHGAEHVYDYLLDFVRRYKGTPYFGLFWVNSFSHDDPNLAFIMDSKILSYLKTLENEGFNDESVIFLLSDHGTRFGDARNTEAGDFEEDLPMLNIWIPPKLRVPKILKSLRENQNRLVNPYDVHKTMLDILRRSGYNAPASHKDSCPNCSSIFVPLSSNRKCEDIRIPAEFCACKEYKSIPVDSKLAVIAASGIVKYFNEFKNTYKNRSFHNLCRDLSLGRITDAHEDAETKSVVVHFETEPNKGRFKVTVKFSQNATNFTKPNFLVRRTNLYGNDSHCINDSQLLKICYCKV